MPASETSVPVARLIGLFCVLFALGVALTLPLYKFDFRKFASSNIIIKIIFWIPIFLVFIGVLYADNGVRLAVLAVLLVIALIEFLKVLSSSKFSTLIAPAVFLIFFCFALLHFSFLALAFPKQFVNLMIIICLASVLSDVTAFFMGNYFGKHKLPDAFNKNKSWEGVAGQIIGAFIGVLLVNAFVVRVPTIMIFLPIGLGAAAGDLANSFTKRKLNIKDWSRNIPGHGGFIDRLSSLAGSAFFVFYFLKLIHFG